MDDWLGDVLLETFPCFVLTEEASRAISSSRLTGANFAPFEISLSEQFLELQANVRLPRFLWMQVVGKAGMDDFGIDRSNQLVVSQQALALLRRLGLGHAEIDTLPQESV
jgi:hypothetical protein